MIQGAVKRLAAVVRHTLVLTGVDRILAEFTPGAPMVSVRARLAPGNLLYPTPSIRTIVRNGIRFELDVSDYMQWCVYYGIEIEPRSALYALVAPGGVVVDVGANVGETLLNFARLVGERGEVIAFEINPATHRRCLRNISLNSFKNVRLFDLGLGSEGGAALLASPNARNSGEDRVVHNQGRSGINVEMTTMDSFVAEHAIARIDLIKIDVEGFEMNVLRGARETLERFQPRLFVEVSDVNLRQQESSATELLEFLERLGYRLTHAQQNRPVTSADSAAGQHFDIIARPS
jgi:FkbM family methyltransferase